jgi:hypothetical protein
VEDTVRTHVDVAGWRRLTLAFVAAVAFFATGSSAAHAKGWKLELKNSIGGATTKTTGKHCGKTKFGTWAFRGTIALQGTVAQLRWKMIVTRDGALHPVTGVSVTGSAPASAQDTLRQTFGTLHFRYVAGATPKLTSQTPDGATFSTMTFRPKQSRRC